jgi:hypothetical protein
MSRLLHDLDGGASDDDWDDDDDQQLSASLENLVVERPKATTLAAAAAPARKQRAAPSPVHRTTTTTTATTNAIALLAEERREQERVCAELQRDELAQLTERFGTRITVQEAAGSCWLAIAFDGLMRLDVVVLPRYPRHESVDLRVNADDADLRALVADVFKRASSAESCFLVRFVVELDDRVAQRTASLLERAAAAKVQAATEATLSAVLSDTDIRLTEPSDAPVEFFGSLVQTEPFRLEDAFESVGHTATLVGTMLYVIGGVAMTPLSDVVVPNVRVFDLVQRTWFVPETVGFSLDANLLHHATCRVGNRLYCFGGEQFSLQAHRVPPAAVRVLDIASFVWTEVAFAPYPPALSHLTATRVGDEVFLVGGQVGDVRSNLFGATIAHLYVFDVRAEAFWFKCSHGEFLRRDGRDVCSQCSTAKVFNLAVALRQFSRRLPAIREHTATRIGRFIFVACGVQDGAMISSRCFLIDTATELFRLIEVDAAPPARPRAGHMAIRVGRFVALLGGRSFNDTAVFDVELFDLQDRLWITRRAPETAARLFGTAVPFSDGRVLVALGCCMVRNGLTRLWNGAFVQQLVQKPLPAVLVNVGLPVPLPASTLTNTLMAALESGADSDISYRERFRLHRVVLQARCPRLLELLEAQQLRAVDEFSDDAMRVLFRHVYGGEPVNDAKLRGEFASVFHLAHLVNDELVQPTVQASLGALFDDAAARAKYADVRFVCGDDVFRVSRLFVSRAVHFSRALEAGMLEAQTGVFTVDDVDSATLEALLRFLYVDAVACPAEHAVELLALADRCQLDALKKHAELLIECSQDFDAIENVCELVDVATRYGATHLQRMALNVLASNFAPNVVLEHASASHADSAVVQMIRNAARK